MYYDTIQFYNQIVEVVLLTLAIICLTKPKENKLLFFLSSISVNAIIYYVIYYYRLRDQTLCLLLILANCILLKFFKKDFSLRDIVGVSLAYLTYLLCVYVSIQLFTLKIGFTAIEIIARCSVYTLINLALLSKFIYIGFIILFAVLKSLSFLDRFEKVYHIWYIFVLSVANILLFEYIKSMFRSYYNSGLIFEIIKNIIVLIILGKLFIFLIKKYKEYYVDNSEEKLKEKLKVKYREENLKNLKSIKMDIDNKEHRMNYILQAIEYDLMNQSYSEALNKLAIAKELVAKIEPVIYTENEMFDFMINMEIKHLYLGHKKIKVGTFISKNDGYNEYSIWNTIVELIRMISENYDYFEIFMIEKNESILEVKFIINDERDNHILIDKFRNIKENVNIKHIDHLLTMTYKENLMTN